MSIKKTLQITLILFTSIPLIVFTIFTSYYTSKEIISTKKIALQTTAISNANEFTSLLKPFKTDLSELSANERIISLLQEYTSSPKNSILSNTNRLQSAMRFILEHLNSRPSYRHIDLYDSNFTKLLSSDSSLTNYSNQIEPLLHNVKTKKDLSFYFHTSSVTDTTSKVNSLEIAYPILSKANDTILGYLTATIDIRYFDSFLSKNHSKLRDNIIFYDITDNIPYSFDTKNINNRTSMDESLICSTNSNALKELITYNMAAKTKAKITKAGTYSSIDESTKPFVTYHEYSNGKHSLYAYTQLPNTNWALILQDTIYDNYIFDYLKVFLFIIIVTFIALYFASLKLTNCYTKPIIQLKDIIKQASNGNLNVKSDFSANNEIGDLSKSFNRMLHVIKTNYDELTEMHQTLIDKEEELRNNYEQIEYLAYHDVLTKLPNKLTFHNKMNETLESTCGRNQCHAVFFVDLDNFKTINDTLGHDYGDRLLSKTSAKLNSLMTKNDILARAGGDEFLIFKENIENTENASNFAKEILNTFKNPLNLHGKLVYISMSIGIAMYPDNGVTSKILIKNADIAMYQSKDTGRNKVTLFNKRMQDELNRSAEILEVLRHAVENNEVYLMYQPQVSITTKEVIGYEALMRIHNKKLGILSPTEFIPIAEDSGLIIDLGAWALYEACRFTKELIDEQGFPITVSVNISSIQLNRPGFFTTLADVLDKTELPPECLELEITESTLLYSILDSATLLKNFQTLGVKIALDDFGTGYSSLNYLTNMPINTLKIDKSFIDNIVAKQKDTYIAETIIQLAHNLNIHVIAEGVENHNQLTILEKYNCDLIQGYLFSKPLSSVDIKVFVEG